MTQTKQGVASFRDKVSQFSPKTCPKFWTGPANSIVGCVASLNARSIAKSAARSIAICLPPRSLSSQDVVPRSNTIDPNFKTLDL